MAMKGDMMKTCMGGMCGKCHGTKTLVAGLVLLATAYWWPGSEWWAVGGLLTLGGLLKLVKPMCPHCA